MEVLLLTVSVLFMQHPRVNRLEKQGIAVAGGRKGKEKRGRGEEDINTAKEATLDGWQKDLYRMCLPRRENTYTRLYIMLKSVSFRWRW